MMAAFLQGRADDPIIARVVVPTRYPSWTADPSPTVIKTIDPTPLSRAIPTIIASIIAAVMVGTRTKALHRRPRIAPATMQMTANSSAIASPAAKFGRSRNTGRTKNVPGTINIQIQTVPFAAIHGHSLGNTKIFVKRYTLADKGSCLPRQYSRCTKKTQWSLYTECSWSR
jgi:hypothetical protein